MDYASSQRNAKRNIVGLTGVVLLHLFVIYALMTGLGQKTLKILIKPLETKIIEEVIPPPPPPPPPKKVEAAPPKAEAPPPPFVPPPEVVVAVSAAPVISSVSITPPVVMPVIAPPPPPAPVAIVAIPAPPPAPKPKVRSGVTPTHKEECTYPRQALRKGVAGGDFMTLLNVDEKGNVTKVELLEGKRTDGFDRELERCLIGWKFEADGGKYQVKAPFEFKLTE
jgi:protein TonB